MFNRGFEKVCLLLLILIQTCIRAENLIEDTKIFDNDPEAKENPEETGPYLEGDINGEAIENLRDLRNGIVSTSYRWPNGVVPYEIKGKFTTIQLGIISHALNEYHTKTCIRFRSRTTERDYVVINSKPTGCWSSVGRMGGVQVVNLEAPKCFSNYGTTIHELMHALGFYHEQSRYERDSYIRIITENIKDEMIRNFEKLPFTTATAYGVNYDYASVMHYKTTTFSKNGKSTIEAIRYSPDVSKMGQRLGFSTGDIRKIKAMYRCQ